MKRLFVTAIVLSFILAAPAWAEDSDTSEPSPKTQSSPTDDIGWRGWGPRVGVGVDPDQVIVGAHFNLGRFIPHLRFQPDVELGFGDDFTILSGSADVHWMFNVDKSFTPYAGGGLVLAYVDKDKPNSDSSFEIGLKLAGGLEWKLSGGSAFFVELDVNLVDTWDAQIMVGWTF